jgi:polyhydroxybutyrate depolymerase
MPRHRACACLLVALLVVAGCGGGDDDAGPRTTTTDATAETAPITAAAPTCAGGWVAGRAYVLCSPGGPAEGLVVALHGRGSSAADMQAMTRLEEPAAAAGLAVVYPEGTGGGWGDDTFAGDGDLVFLDALVDELADGPVGVVGFSNGASMALRYASQRPDRVRAVVAVAGQLPRDPAVRPSGRVPLLAVYGSDDPIRPFATGIAAPATRAPGQPTPTLPTPDTVAAFAGSATHAGPEPSDPDPADGTHVLTERWTDGQGTVAMLRTVMGGGHTWPSGRIPARADFGVTSRDLDASAEAVAFVAEGDVSPTG